MRAAVLGALAFALLPGAAAGQDQELLGRPEIEEIHFVGNATFATDTLKRAIVNRETECRVGLLEWLPPLCPAGVDFAEDRHYLIREELPRDAIRLRLYYWQRGFREATVTTNETSAESNKVELLFTIDEGEPVRVDSIAVVGGEELENPSLLTNLPLRSGDPLSAIAVEATRDSLENRLHDAGYAYALVLLRTSLPSGSHSAAVTFDVDPGPRAHFGPIEILGNEELSDDVIRRMIGFREGDLYGTSKILDAQRNLFGLEMMQYARVDPLPTADLDTIIPIRVEVTEGDEFRVRAGAGWTTAECLTTEAQWTARNFFGGARRLQIRGRLSNVLAESLQDPFCTQAGVGPYGKLNWLLTADFSQPWIFSPRNSLAVGIYGERTSLPDVFVRTAVGANFALVRALGRGASLSVTYRPQLSKLDAAQVFFCTSFLACDPEDIDILQSANWLSPVGANASVNRTDNLLNPRTGYRASLDYEHASDLTGSDFPYNRLLTEASAYQGIVGNTVIAARIRGGWIGAGTFSLLTGSSSGNEIVHPQKRFFAGGSNSVRGYAQNRLGPKVLTVSVERLLVSDSVGAPPVCTVQQVIALICDASGLDPDAFTPQPTGGTRLVEGNLELRIPITARAFEGVAFLDFGQVWAETDKASLGDLAWTPGVGVRYYSTFGPIRLDVGYRPGGGEILPVITSRVQACAPSADPECKETAPGVGFVRSEQLAVMIPRVPFETNPSFLERLQFHFSIGQAF